jgi:hypothetical protein
VAAGCIAILLLPLQFFCELATICKHSEANTEQIHFYEILPIWNTRDFRENSVLNGYYAASSGLFGFLTFEDGTDRLSLNVAKGLPLLVA